MLEDYFVPDEKTPQILTLSKAGLIKEHCNDSKATIEDRKVEIWIISAK
jgi:hypothetical protein